MTGLGDHRGLKCPGCGVQVRSKDPALWLERSGKDARAWHFQCRLVALQEESPPSPLTRSEDGRSFRSATMKATPPYQTTRPTGNRA